MQVVLALQLPFTLVPLIKATSSSQLMGEFSSSRWLAGASWAATALIFVANLTLFLLQLAPALVLPDVQTDSHDAILHQVGLAGVWQAAVQSSCGCNAQCLPLGGIPVAFTGVCNIWACMEIPIECNCLCYVCDHGVLSCS
jgi:hypothetical protein